MINRLNNIFWNSATISPGAGAVGFQDKHVANVQKLNDAYSTVVNMDYFPITITKLPTVNGVSWGPAKFLDYIRRNINNFVDTDYSEFTPFKWNNINDASLWNSDDPLGAIVNIDIKGPNNGSVIVSAYSSDKWIFTTIYEPVYGEHPVSGNRDFGFTYNPDGSYTFYTRGVDRLTDIYGEALRKYADNFPFRQADKLWYSFQERIHDFVKYNQGSASIGTPNIGRPNWKEVKDVLDGKSPLSLLGKDCPN